MLAGEITTNGWVDFQEVAREVMRDVGYLDAKWGIGWDTCSVLLAIHSQSPDIAMGVNEDQTKGKEIGAGDQGLMFGYAINDTPELMPLPIALAHRITNALTDARKQGVVKWLRPDSKSQVTVEFDGNRPVRIDNVVVSTQHDEQVQQKEIHDFVRKQVIEPCLPPELVDGKIKYHINPTGRFVVGGPHGDTGLTGRKIIVDSYGGWGRHGGGAFSGKDPTKVDRSAAYMARHVAKNIVAARLGRSLRSAVGLCHRRDRSGERARGYRRDRTRSTTSGFANWCAKCSRCRPAASSSISTCGGRFIAKRRPAGILAATTRNSPGKARTARPSWPKRAGFTIETRPRSTAGVA